MMPILEMRKLDPREMQWPAQGHTVSKSGLHIPILYCYLLSSSTMHWDSYTMCVRMTAWQSIR